MIPVFINIKKNLFHKRILKEFSVLYYTCMCKNQNKLNLNLAMACTMHLLKILLSYFYIFIVASMN